MELQYLNLLEEHKLKLSDLPEDARVGIDNIQAIVKMVAMSEKKGKRINQTTFKKISAFDKWVCMEIMDFMDDTDKNKKPMPDVKEVIEEVKKADAEPTKVVETKKGATESKGEPEPKKEVKKEEASTGDNQIGYEINAELEAMYNSGTHEYKFDQLKLLAPKSYNLIFDGYESESENGIRTSQYTLLESEKETFKITKK